MRILSRVSRPVTIALLLAAVPARLTAQSNDLHEGARVRITTPTIKHATGVVQNAGPDSIVVLTEPFGAPVRVARAEISAMEVSQGRLASEGAKKGAIWGGIFGVVIGVIAVASPPAESNPNYRDPGEPSDFAFLAANTVGMIGAGAAIGALIKSERWSRVSPVPRISVGAGKFSAGFSLPFPRRD